MGAASAQPSAYTVANCHSHNDYEQDVPFWKAYKAGFGSIEADIFLENGELYVAHDRNELKSHKTLEKYYLAPLQQVVKKNKGYPFPDSTRQLQILIDIKTDSIGTLNQLIKLLNRYPLLSASQSIEFVISGNRPDASLFMSYPSFIWFDGVLSLDYPAEALGKITMLSDDFKSYSHWDGKGDPPQSDWNALGRAVDKAHLLGKTVRFWDAPDELNAWEQLMKLKVDYINTDKILELSNFLKD